LSRRERSLAIRTAIRHFLVYFAAFFFKILFSLRSRPLYGPPRHPPQTRRSQRKKKFIKAQPQEPLAKLNEAVTPAKEAVSQWGKQSETVGKVEKRPWFPAFAGKTYSD
jgi:hypothetical protein